MDNSRLASKLFCWSSGDEKFLLKSKPVSPIDLTKSFFNKSLISLKAAIEYSFALCGCIPAVEIQVLGYLWVISKASKLSFTEDPVTDNLFTPSLLASVITESKSIVKDSCV